MAQRRPALLARPAPPPFDGLYCMPAAAALEKYLCQYFPECLELPDAVYAACARAVAAQLGCRRLAQRGIELLAALAVHRALAPWPDIPHARAVYAAHHYARWAVRFAQMRAPRVALPPMQLATHFSDPGIFVME